MNPSLAWLYLSSFGCCKCHTERLIYIYLIDSRYHSRNISWTKLAKPLSSAMSSDEAYSSFLDQANQETGGSTASATSSSAPTKSVDTDVPALLNNIKQHYASETDEPFEPVALNWSGNDIPTESAKALFILECCSLSNAMLMFSFALDEFKELIGHSSDVSTLSLKEFDPRGEYEDILEAVDRAAGGNSMVYRVDQGKTRAEYYVIGFDEKGKRVVGLKAKAVES